MNSLYQRISPYKVPVLARLLSNPVKTPKATLDKRIAALYRSIDYYEIHRKKKNYVFTMFNTLEGRDMIAATCVNVFFELCTNAGGDLQQIYMYRYQEPCDFDNHKVFCTGRKVPPICFNPNGIH